MQVLTQGTPFTTHFHLNAVACERVSELDVFYPMSFLPVLNVLSFAFCWFQVPMFTLRRNRWISGLQMNPIDIPQ